LEHPVVLTAVILTSITNQPLKMYEKYSAFLFGTVIKVLHDGEEGLVHLRFLPANFESVEVKDPNSEQFCLEMT